MKQRIWFREAGPSAGVDPVRYIKRWMTADVHLFWSWLSTRLGGHPQQQTSYSIKVIQEGCADLPSIVPCWTSWIIPTHTGMPEQQTRLDRSYGPDSAPGGSGKHLERVGDPRAGAQALLISETGNPALVVL